VIQTVSVNKIQKLFQPLFLVLKYFSTI